MADSPVTVSIQENIAVVTIDSPPVNASSQAVRQGLVAALDQVEASDVGAVVLICAGRTFIAGADIREFDGGPFEPILPDVIGRIEMCPRPWVAAIHGTALGGGLEVALGCHYRVAVPTARLGLPEVNLGLIPGAGGTQRLPRIVGRGRALDLILSGDIIDAEEAHRIGLYNRVVPDGDVRRDGVQTGDVGRQVRDDAILAARVGGQHQLVVRIGLGPAVDDRSRDDAVGLRVDLRRDVVEARDQDRERPSL